MASRPCRIRRIDLGDWFHDPRGDAGADRPTPKVEGLQEIFTAMDDIEWTEVKRQRNADGSISVVREKWPIAQPDFMSAYIEYGPGMITRRHGHFGHHLVWVIAGGAWFGDRWCPAGTHIELPFGAAFGPIIAGEEGTLFLELTDGDFRSWGDQPELLRPGDRRLAVSRRCPTRPSTSASGSRTRAATGHQGRPALPTAPLASAS